jgi:hypothetical protein
MLPNEIVDYIVHRNFGEDHEGLGNQQGQGGRLGGPNHLGVGHLGLQDQRAPNSSPRPQTDSNFSDPHMDFRVNGNLRRKLADRIYPGYYVTYSGCWNPLRTRLGF